MKEWITTLLTAAGTLGGWETIKYLFNRKTASRIEEAKADSAEFSVLRDAVVFLQEQLKEKEIRFAEQTAILRAANAENLQLHKEVATLKAERAMKLCEIRGCANREPQSGY